MTLTANNESNSYSSKTYFFMGNLFAEKFNSQIDTMNYSWRDSFANNLHLIREYPKYYGEFRRIENYEYDENDEPKRTVMQTFHYRQKTTDSIVYNNINSNTTEIIKYITGEKPFKEIQRTVKDTLYVDQIIDGEYGFTSREFWETKRRKQSQIIKPELSEVMNIFVHNENGDLTAIERYENGEFIEKTISIEYEYDSKGRIISKKTYYGRGDKKELGSTEITIYDKNEHKK